MLLNSDLHQGSARRVLDPLRSRGHSEAVEPRFAVVSVTDAAGRQQTTGSPHRSPANADELDVRAATYTRATPYINDFNQSLGDFNDPDGWERDRWLSVRSTIGVSRLITNPDGRPIPVPIGIVESLMEYYDGDSTLSDAGLVVVAQGLHAARALAVFQ